MILKSRLTWRFTEISVSAVIVRGSYRRRFQLGKLFPLLLLHFLVLLVSLFVVCRVRSVIPMMAMANIQGRIVTRVVCNVNIEAFVVARCKIFKDFHFLIEPQLFPLVSVLVLPMLHVELMLLDLLRVDNKRARRTSFFQKVSPCREFLGNFSASSLKSKCRIAEIGRAFEQQCCKNAGKAKQGNHEKHQNGTKNQELVEENHFDSRSISVSCVSYFSFTSVASDSLINLNNKTFLLRTSGLELHHESHHAFEIAKVV